jgi:hypothetical protein
MCAFNRPPQETAFLLESTNLASTPRPQGIDRELNDWIDPKWSSMSLFRRGSPKGLPIPDKSVDRKTNTAHQHGTQAQTELKRNSEILRFSIEKWRFARGEAIHDAVDAFHLKLEQQPLTEGLKHLETLIAADWLIFFELPGSFTKGTLHQQTFDAGPRDGQELLFEIGYLLTRCHFSGSFPFLFRFFSVSFPFLFRFFSVSFLGSHRSKSTGKVAASANLLAG